MDAEIGNVDQLGGRLGDIESKEVRFPPKFSRQNSHRIQQMIMEDRVAADENRLDRVIHYIMDEEANAFDRYDACSCSMFGLGPGWTM